MLTERTVKGKAAIEKPRAKPKPQHHSAQYQKRDVVMSSAQTQTRGSEAKHIRLLAHARQQENCTRGP